MTLLVPLGLLALLSLPVLVVFYLFRPDPRQQASTTYFLWKEAVPESLGGKFAQRLRSNPLLWLQILLLILLALYLARPAVPWTSQAPETERLVLVVDLSASMRAGGAFLQAQRRAGEAIEELLGFRLTGGTPEVMLIAVDSEPRVVVPFTKDQADLKRGLESLQLTDQPDQAETLRPFLQSLIKAQRAQVWLFSDRLPEELHIEGLQFTSVAVGTNDNVGVTSFSVRNPDPDRSLDRPFMYARIDNFSEEAQTRILRLEKMNSNSPGSVEALVYEKSILLASKSGQTFVESLSSARLHPTETSLFRLTVAPTTGDKPDIFNTDDVAFSVVAPFNTERVLVCTGPGVKGSFLLRAIAAAQGIKVVDSEQLLSQSAPPSVDLYLAQAGMDIPSKLRVRSVFYIAPDPDPKAAKISPLHAPDPNAPLIAQSGIEWIRQRVQITDLSPLRADETVLLESNGQPALTLSGLAQGRPSLHWRFSPAYSSLPLTPALPLLVGRFIDEYSRVSGVPSAGSITTSSYLQRPSGHFWQGTLQLSPSGGQLESRIATQTASAESKVAPGTPWVGFYTLSSSKRSEYLAVNLFSHRESSLQRHFEDSVFATETHPEATVRTGSEVRYRGIGHPILGGILLLLLLEAAVFLRRGRP